MLRLNIRLSELDVSRCHTDIRVSQNLHQCKLVPAIPQKLHCESVAESMRRETRPCSPRRLLEPFYQEEQAILREVVALRRIEERVVSLSLFVFQVSPYRFSRSFSKGNGATLAPLALYRELTSLYIEVAKTKGAEFGGSYSCIHQSPDNRLVPTRVHGLFGGVKESLNLSASKRVNIIGAVGRRFNALHRRAFEVALCDHPVEEGSNVAMIRGDGSIFNGGSLVGVAPPAFGIFVPITNVHLKLAEFVHAARSEAFLLKKPEEVADIELAVVER